jgi:hypothetical protein
MLRKLITRFMLLGVMCLSSGLMVSNGFIGQASAKGECHSCEYVAGGLELCRWFRPPSGDCGLKPANAVCRMVEECPPLDPEK